ncbi:MAG: type II toxin-antitoxin system ParD family antitoxin [Alphaproteobacteria bacterium]|nr:type II toxin-antitoxin system ParD family antitoxin [Alphaproteobacteria bacterium]
MHIDIPPKLEAFIQNQISVGAYSSAAEVVRDAIRRMEQEQNKLEVLRTAVRAGDKQLDHGESVLLTDALMEEIENNAIKRHKKGEKPNADVTA